jgi:uncharacterized protein (DUF58 family)
MAERARRSDGTLAGAALAAGVGAFAGHPSLFWTAAALVGFAATPALLGSPDSSLDAERSVDGVAGAGERVRVQLTVRNAGAHAVPDLRVIDGVPPALRVVEGSPRGSAALRPGGELTVAYTVEAVHGDHRFGAASAISASLGGQENAASLRPTEDRLCCPAGGEGLGRRLRAAFPSAGERHDEGPEFVSVRRYRRGDPPGRVDWARYARTGELTTVTYAEERAERPAVLVGEATGHPHPAGRALAAVDALEAVRGSPVGLGALGRPETWAPPDSGPARRGAVRSALEPAYGDAGGETPVRPDAWLRRLPGGTRVVVAAAPGDRGARESARLLAAGGADVTVLATECVGGGEPTPANESLRAAGVRVIEWGPFESLGDALARTARR